ncbi:MAG TPA: FKBP-type peptidyl-prolyl cis-trans isomerase [Vicinamibacterales bacterium]|nr:FKBP-type peptidyl-prolyl cis-trans isomerase [Vicinamibacterales bacterium]
MLDRIPPVLSRTAAVGSLVVLAVLTVSGCSRSSEPASRGAGSPRQIPAPSDVAAAPSDASITATGLASKVLVPGTGTRHPRPNSRVTVHYTGWTADGKMFDSSVVQEQPSTFGLDEVIPGWTQGVQMMVPGEKRRFWIPAALAYEGVPDKPQGPLVFDIELIRIDS